jgi:DNA-binding transcriptional ArsR family regulator
MDIFNALAEPTRRNILEMLAKRGQLPASSIYKKFDVSPQAVSQHLKVLREAKLVDVERKAQKRMYQINPKAMVELEDWAKRMNRLWNERFDRLDKLLKVSSKGRSAFG